MSAVQRPRRSARWRRRLQRRDARSSMHGSSLSRRDALRRSRLFARLGDGELDSILAHAMVRRYEEGDQIFAKGDPGNSMMAVLRGRVTVSAPSADGRQVVLTTMREGDVVGEIALLDGRERTADVTAAADCELLVVPRHSLLALLDRHPELCIDFLVVLCERLRSTNEQVEDLAFLELEARLAKTLLRLEQENGASGHDKTEGVKISQRALGEMVGGSRESVNKHLQDWKRSGIIALERGSIVIYNRQALAAMA
jgi:CRP/FNR family transcriptional regulator, cyclic AMP receptor protein